jgi:HPt (histidine-containing phosphotransfer) domain-containing protein
MTAHTMTHEKVKAVDAGMNDHIGKPFDEAGFYRVLAKWIPRSKQHLQGVAMVSPTPESSGGIPALAGVDTQAGLSLLQGDKTRYRHWLNDFVLQAPAAIAEIRRALAAGESEPASMTAHTLKGRMGLLGMKELHGIAAALETAIDGAAPTTQLLLDLERGISAMCAEIESGLGSQPSATTTASPVSDMFQPGK